MVVDSIVKNPFNNSAVYVLDTNTTLPFMQNLDYSSIINLGFPDSSYSATFVHHSNGTIIVYMNYTVSLYLG